MNDYIFITFPSHKDSIDAIFPIQEIAKIPIQTQIVFQGIKLYIFQFFR